jgi:fatty-acyl-CoA synthase
MFGFLSQLKRDGVFIAALWRTLKRLRDLSLASPHLVADELEHACDRFPTRTAFLHEGVGTTYASFETRANRFANLALDLGLKRGEVVAVLMSNQPDLIAAWVGLSKAGVSAALINSNLTGAALLHCMSISGAQHVFVDIELASAFETIRETLPDTYTIWSLGGMLPGSKSLDEALGQSAAKRPAKAVRAGMKQGDVALYIYTSGTTGLPKAAKVTHMRVLTYMRGFAAATNAGPDDRIYITLPLYHATGGICAIGAALLNGGCAILKKRFSTSAFWDDIRVSGATMFVYIGELCRYLVNMPEAPGEDRHTIRLAFGNGLRPDVWARMDKRFHIPRIIEFYGATEGNVSLLNFDGRMGAVGRVPPWLRFAFNVAVVKFDVNTGQPVRDARGRCTRCKPGEAGEVLGRIGRKAREAYAGYSNSAESQKKILTDVFKPGDRWFRTGDIMSCDRAGYFTFIDRVGDTFRWKGENVATSEVEEALATFPGIDEAIAYGVAVPHTEGRAGMAAIIAAGPIDWTALNAHLMRELPAFARPVFLRPLTQAATTGTFKHRKADLVRDGYDINRMDGAMMRTDEGGFVPLSPDLYARIQAGQLRL